MTGKRVLILQNADDSGPGVLRGPLIAAGLSHEVQSGSNESDFSKSALEYDALIVLGGPQCALDVTQDPALANVALTIQLFHEQKRPVLGICLGGQLVAQQLGGKVRRNNRAEFGFVEVRAIENDGIMPEVSSGLCLMQYHDDSFSRPAGAKHLLSSETCADQAFRLGNSIGLQCHPEVDQLMLPVWMDIRRQKQGGETDVSMALRQAERHHASAMAFGQNLARNFADLINSSS